MLTSVGLFYVQGPPVPIPNTVVKLLSAEDTRLEATWENRSRPTFLFLHSSMAEHPAVNRRVVSSSLTGGAIKDVICLLRQIAFFFAPLGMVPGHERFHFFFLAFLI